MHWALGTNKLRLYTARLLFYYSRASFSQIFPSAIHQSNVHHSRKDTFPSDLFTLTDGNYSARHQKAIKRIAEK